MPFLGGFGCLAVVAIKSRTAVGLKERSEVKVKRKQTGK